MKDLNFTERAVPGLTANFLMKEAQSRYHFSLKYLKPKSLVYDLACGTGYGADILSKKAAFVLGVDKSNEALDFASQNFSSHKVGFLNCDVNNTCLRDKSADLITAFEMIEHLEGPATFLREVNRILKRDGYFIISTPNRLVQSPNGVLVSPYHTREYSASELNLLLCKHFKNIIFFGQRKSKKAIDAYSNFLNSQKARQLLVDIDIFRVRTLLSKTYKEIFWKKIGGPFGRASQEKVTNDDFIFSKNNIDASEYIIAVCKK